MRHAVIVLALLSVGGLAWWLIDIVQIGNPRGTELYAESRAQLDSVPDDQRSEKTMDASLPAPLEAERRRVGVSSASKSADVKVVTVRKTRRNEHSTPSPLIHFRVGMGASVGFDEITRGETDESGVALVAIPLDRVLDETQTWIWAEIEERGYQSSSCVELLPTRWTEGSNPPSLELRVLTGVTVRGFVYDRDGQPANASVRWCRESEPFVWRFARLAETKDGHFTAHLPQSGRYRFTARDSAFKSGTAAIDPMSIDVFDSCDDLEMTLVGPGVLQGCVVDSLGEPAAGVELVALTETAHSGGDGSIRIPQNIRDQYEWDGKGYHLQVVETDSRGRFRFEGLRDDLFVIRASTMERENESKLLTPIAVSSDGEELRLELNRAYIAVRIADSDGKAVDVDVAKEHGFPRRWPTKPTVMALPVAESANDPFRSGRIIGKSPSPGLVVFEPRPGQSYQIVLFQPEAGLQSETVFVSEDSRCIDVTFALQSPSSYGRLEVSAYSPDGELLEDGVRVRVVDPASDVPLVWSDGWMTSWPASFHLPPGDYRVEAYSISLRDPFHGTVAARREYSGCEIDVSVCANDVSHVQARLARPCRINVLAEGEFNAKDEDAVRRDFPGYEFEESEIAAHASQVTLKLLKDGRYPEDVFFARMAMKNTSAAGIHEMRSVELGYRESSEPILPGRYTLIASLPGGRTIQRNIEFLEGEEIELTLKFAPE